MMNDLNMEAVIDAAARKNVPLTPELLINITDTETNTYGLLKLLCAYINALSAIGRDNDLRELCDKSLAIEDLQKKNQILQSQLGDALTGMLKAREELVDAKQRVTEKEMEISSLQIRLRELENKARYQDLLRE